MTMYTKTLPLLVSLFAAVQSKPQYFVLTKRSLDEPVDRTNGETSGPIISKLHVTSDIQFRYAQTQVLSYVKNPSSKAEEISFTAVIPDSAFISNFSMVVEGKEYVGEVKAKEDAKKEYEEAVTEGRGAGLVSQDARDANKFTVATNVEAGHKVEFKLHYQELLERKLGKYQHVINVNPGQIVEDLRIQIFINESLPIKSLAVPELKESNDIDFEENQESKIAKVERFVDGDSSKAKVTFAPDRVYQEEAGEQGLSGQFLVEYDVVRNGQDNEIQVVDGYFVHYFTPEDLPTLPKHVIFVLDISGSMSGEKMNQLKDAMFTILDDMTERDFFNIVTFSSGVSQWNPTLGSIDLINVGGYYNDYDDTTPAPLQNEQFVIEATDKNKKDAIKYIIDIPAGGGTNINDGLLEGLKIAKFVKENEKLPGDMKSILVFLSDGQGNTDRNTIKRNIRKANALKVPIYSLGFGRGADFDLIKDISAKSDAFSKQIYEGSDAAIQLENFFAEISSPLLSNLKFQYVGGLMDNSSVSEPQVRTFFKGGEFVVAGKLGDLPQTAEDDVIDVTVTGDGRNGEQYLRRLQICLNPSAIPDHSLFGGGEREPVSDHSNDNDSMHLVYPSQPSSCVYPSPIPRSQAQNFLQKLHAFLNIKQLLKKVDQFEDEDDNSKNPINDIFKEFIPSQKSNKEIVKAKALQLALDNNFVTELTSLVVIRPEEEPKISNLKENKPDYGSVSYAAASGYGAPAAAYYSPPAAASAYNAPAYGGYASLSASGASGYGARPQYAPRPQYTADLGPVSGGFLSSVKNLISPLTNIVSKTTNNLWKTFVQPNIKSSKSPIAAYAPPPRNPAFNARPPLQQPQAPVTPAPVLDLPKPGPIMCSGNITLFSKTYLRGENVTYSADTEDLEHFDDKLVSIEVEGGCCWEVFTEVGFEGDSQDFEAGKYTSLVQVGEVFRDGSSLRRRDCEIFDSRNQYY